MKARCSAQVSRFDQGEIDLLLPAFVLQSPRLGHTMRSNQVGDTGSTGGTSASPSMRLPESMQMNHVCSANESLKIGLRPSQCQTIR
jgi:hypothetical protein